MPPWSPHPRRGEHGGSPPVDASPAPRRQKREPPSADPLERHARYGRESPFLREALFLSIAIERSVPAVSSRMNGTEIQRVVDALVRELGIDRASLLRSLEQSIATDLESCLVGRLADGRAIVSIDRRTGEMTAHDFAGQALVLSPPEQERADRALEAAFLAAARRHVGGGGS